MIWTLIYGGLLLAVLPLVLKSDSHVMQKMWGAMLISWAATNLAAVWPGLAHDSAIIAPVDGILAVMVGWMGYRARSVGALIVVCLFMLEEVLHVERATHAMLVPIGRYEQYLWHVAFNAIFAAQVLTIGGLSAGMAVRDSRFRWSWRPLRRSRA